MPTYPTYKLGDVAEIINGKNQKEVVSPQGKYPIYGSGGIIGWATDYLCKENSTIIGRKGTIDSPIFVNRKFWNVDTAFGIQPSKKVLPRYLFFFCKSFDFKKLDKSTTIPSLAKRDLLQIPIPLPLLATQHAIVSRIESLFSELDKAEERLRTAQQQLKIYRQAVLNHWLNNEDGKWEMVKLGDVAEAIDPEPSHRTPKIAKQGIPFISIKDCDYKTNTINFENARLVSSSILVEHKNRYTISEGDFIIGKIGTIGNPVNVVLPQEYALSANVVLIKAADRVNSKFLYNLFRSVIIEKQLLKGKKATTQAAFGIQKVRLLEIPLPPLPEQQRIVKEIESRLSQTEATEACIAESLQQTEALRQSILKKAFSGELV